MNMGWVPYQPIRQIHSNGISDGYLGVYQTIKTIKKVRRIFMSIAVGMIETLGFPAVVEAADAMVKAAQVTLVGYEKIGSGRVTVIVRGNVSEVQASIAAGIESIKRVNGGSVLSTHIIARPHENLEYVLPIRYTEAVTAFRDVM
jgi:carbon dioxide concentrating mechanism protein CcmK